MNARDDLKPLLLGLNEHERNTLLDAFRAEVLREAADRFDRENDDNEILRGDYPGATLRAWAAASSGAAAGDKQPETEALCRCGHGKHRHVDPPGTPICMDCPGDEERSWRHPYTPASKGGA